MIKTWNTARRYINFCTQPPSQPSPCKGEGAKEYSKGRAKVYTMVGLLSLLSVATLSFNTAHADDDDDDDDEWEHRSYQIKGPGSMRYREECGSCHIAYPPRFLGKASWQRIMGELENHFGESAELESSEREAISQYLSKYSSTSRWYRFWEKSNSKGAPTRITETRAFRHEHDEIPRRFIINNEEIRSLSQCDSCHLNASKGNFNEHQIRIPGVGYWEDD